jgi:hypothetical protein
MQPKYPNVTVQLSNEDGNAFAILGRVTRAMKQGNCTKQQCEEFMSQAMSGDYDNVLKVCMEYVNVT